MERIFIIPCKYSDEKPFIYGCVDSIRKYYTDKIVIIDSDSDDTFYLDLLTNQYDNIDVLNIKNKNFMTGAIWKVYEKYDSDTYYCLHDSIKVLGNLLNYEKYDVTTILKSEDWKWPYHGDTRNHDWAKLKIEHTKIKFKDGGFDEIIGPMFIIKKQILDELKDLKFNEILPSNKSEMEMMERLWGMAFDFLKIKFTENVVLKNRCSGSEKEIIKINNYKTGKDVTIDVKTCKHQKDDLVIKYWSGRK